MLCCRMKNGSLAVCRNGDAELNAHGLFSEAVMVNRMTERCLPELFFAGLVWSLWFVFRVLWSLRRELSKWVLGVLMGQQADDTRSK